MRTLTSCLAAVALGSFWGGRAEAQPSGVSVVRALGERARTVYGSAAPAALAGIVQLPRGVRGADLGLKELAPGFARLAGSPAAIVAFADAHPELPIGLSPPLHLLLDTAGRYVGATAAHAAGHEGAGALVGIADTGVDVQHADFKDANGNSRVAWFLDLSSPPLGMHPDLESAYGTTDTKGRVLLGAVWSKDDIDAALGTTAGPLLLPQDELGHGTLVAACAAAREDVYEGVAPQAGLVVARISDANEVIANDTMLRGVQFLFDMADSMGQPIAVNLSIGTDYGPHDGTLPWEQVLASHVGPSHPGHALVVAAGNSGSIADVPVHESVYVSPGATVRIPFLTVEAINRSSIGVWVAKHAGADLAVGLDSGSDRWVAPVATGKVGGSNAPGFDATAVIDNDSGVPVPTDSRGATVSIEGTWPAGTYSVTLTGSGTADLYIEGLGDVGRFGAIGFGSGVREGTINIPATHPDIIGVGCTINKRSWITQAGVHYGVQQPQLDAVGGQPLVAPDVVPLAGEPCWFSSAGPTLTGQPKPEIMAPGAVIVGALSSDAVPPAMQSIFTENCPSTDPSCQVLDQTHALSEGTSFSAPLVAGAAALLFEQDPTLTQADIVAALQGGAHRLRGSAPYFDDDQAGPGELDVMGALAAVDRLHDPELALPVRAQSWISLSSVVYLADGSTPLQAIVELRTAPSASGQPQPADGFGAGRVAAYALVDGAQQAQAATIARRGPGVWVAQVALPAGLGGSSLTVGATFDGADIVEPKSVPIATDIWNGEYAPSVRGGCGLAGAPTKSPVETLANPWPSVLPVAVVGVVSGMRRRRSRRAVGRR